MMKTEYSFEKASVTLKSQETETTAFRCPECMMADTCSDCSMFGSDGRCNKWGGYVDANKWACPWYYAH